jgi:hypothetical protein
MESRYVIELLTDIKKTLESINQMMKDNYRDNTICVGLDDDSVYVLDFKEGD